MGLINEEMVVCDVVVGSVGMCFLELFERVTLELFSSTPGALLTARVRAISRVLSNLVQEVGALRVPLVQGQRIFR